AARAGAARTVAAFATRALATLACTIAARGRLRLRHAFRTRQQRLHRQTKTSTLVAVDELHLHAVALLDHVLRLLGALPAHLRDVHEAFGARHDLDKRAERRGRLHSSLIGLTDHRLGRERLHHLARALHRLAADRCD